MGSNNNGKQKKSGRPLKVVGRGGAIRPARRRKGTDESEPAPVSFPVVVEFVRARPAPGPESLKNIYQCARWLSQHGKECVTVVGHANNRGWTAGAKALARARVAAVTDLLVLLGAKPAQLIPISATRLHSIPVGSTLGERRQHRVVVIFRHEPPQVRLRQTLRRATGR